MIIIMNKQFLLASPLPGHSDISSYLIGDNLITCKTCKTLPATGYRDDNCAGHCLAWRVLQLVMRGFTL